MSRAGGDQAHSLRTMRNEGSGIRDQGTGDRGQGSANAALLPRLAPDTCTLPPRSSSLARGAPLLAIASGKGGVGKTMLAINLSLALHARGWQPLLLDLDGGLANVDVALGLAPCRHVGHVLAGQCALHEALIDHEGLAILPNGCGQADLADPGEARRTALLDAAAACPGRNLLVADTHPGIGPMPVDVLCRARISIIVSTPEPTAITDTYALFKVLGEREPPGRAGLVINQAGTPQQAEDAARHLDSVARRFLGRGIAYWGSVPQEGAVPRSVRQQQALLTAAPRSAAAHSIRQIAARVAALLNAEEKG